MWSCGFETTSASGDEEYTFGSGETLVTSPVHSGIRALRVTTFTSGSPKFGGYKFQAANNDGPFFFRFYFRYAALPSASNNIFTVEQSSQAHLADINLDQNAQLQLSDEDGVIGSLSSALTVDTWYRIEVQVDRTPAAGSHVVRAKIDGTEFAGSAS